MITTTTEIADGIFRISTFVPDAGMSFNQILVRADEPLLFHTGMRALFPAVVRAVEAVLPVSSLRWIGFGWRSCTGRPTRATGRAGWVNSPPSTAVAATRRSSRPDRRRLHAHALVARVVHRPE